MLQLLENKERKEPETVHCPRHERDGGALK